MVLITIEDLFPAEEPQGCHVSNIGIKCSPTTTMSDIRATVSRVTGVSGNNFHLVLPGTTTIGDLTFGKPLVYKMVKIESEYQIFYRDLVGKSKSLEVKGSNKVEEIKEKIYVKEGIPPHLQRLVFGGKNLEDEHILRSYDILKEATIHLVLRLGGCIRKHVTVLLKNAKKFKYNFCGCCHISAIKDEVMQQTGIKIEKQRLFFKGKELNDGTTLTAYTGETDVVLHLAVL